jgi:DNA polymerase-1
MFLPRHEDHVIVSADFSGQELRLMASESKEPVLLDAYLNTPVKDIHSLTAANLCPILLPRLLPSAPNMRPTYEEFVGMLKYDGEDESLKKLASVAKSIRNVYAKQTNFLIIYGGGPGTLARNVGIPSDLARSIIDAWFKAFPGVQRWQEATTEFAKREGYALTAYGNRRHVTEGILSHDQQEAGRWSRQAVNYQIQGCAADILKVVLAEAHRTELFSSTGSVLIAPIYDEITSSVPKGSAVEYIRRLVELMAVTPPGHAIPMEAEVSIGARNWGELIELGANPTDDAILAACEGTHVHH